MPHELYRPILTIAEVDALLPKSACEVSFVCNGDTSFSMCEMKKVIDQYGFQVREIAQWLKESTFEAPLQNIQWFAYNFFQYKQDGIDQYMCSPACSYAQRFEGIDCKSYSILVACILNELSIKNSLRKVAYSYNKGYSHVYKRSINRNCSIMIPILHSIAGAKNAEQDNAVYPNATGSYMYWGYYYYIQNGLQTSMYNSGDPYCIIGESYYNGGQYIKKK